MKKILLTVLTLLLAAPVFAQTTTKPPVLLEWSGNTEADLAGYKIYRGNLTCDQQGPLQSFATVPLAPNVAGSYTDSTVPASWFTVCYWITAYDKSNNESGKSLPAGKTYYTAPGTVTGITLVSASATSLSIKWPGVGDGKGNPAQYNVRYAPAPSLTNAGWGAATSVLCGLTTEPSCTLPGLTAGVPYEIQVVAYRADPTGNVFSPLSSVFSATTTVDTTPPAVPQNLRVTEQPTVGSVILEWELPEGVRPVSHRIDRFSSSTWVAAKSVLGTEREAQVALATTGRRLFRVCTTYATGELCNTKRGVWVAR